MKLSLIVVHLTLYSRGTYIIHNVFKNAYGNIIYHNNISYSPGGDEGLLISLAENEYSAVHGDCATVRDLPCFIHGVLKIWLGFFPKGREVRTNCCKLYQQYQQGHMAGSST